MNLVVYFRKTEGYRLHLTEACASLISEKALGKHKAHEISKEIATSILYSADIGSKAMRVCNYEIFKAFLIN